MKKQLLILISFLLGYTAFSQSVGQNYVKTTVYKTEVSDITNLQNVDPNDKTEQITYYDGLGRPIQIINHRQSASGKDIIQHIEYDNLGRQVKEYLPFTNDSSSLDYQEIDGSNVSGFYDGTEYQLTQYPFSEKEFEASPLNRVLKQAAPGDDWALGLGHEIKYDYKANAVTDEVKLFEFSFNYTTFKPSNLHQNGFYTENQLYKNIVVDENNSMSGTQTQEFKNKQGQVILKRIKTNSENFDTYYIYDDFGNLTYVLPPLASDTTINTTILNNLCYQYIYDYRNRLIEKKIPGKQWEFIVYDKLDRVRATGPVQSPFKNTSGQIGWLYTKYDAFNRPILTAWKSGTVSSSMRSNLEDNFVNNNPLSESRGSSSVLTIETPYTNNSYPKVGYHILSINYYDDYDFGLGSGNPTPPTQVLGQDIRDATNGNCKTLATGSWVRVLQNSAQTKGKLNYTFYKTDRLASPVFTRTNYPDGGYTSTSSFTDFEGKVLQTITHHKFDTSAAELTTEENFTYSAQGRLLSTTEKVNSDPVENIATNRYKELGELKNKKVGGSGHNPLQNVDYTYNIRGWLTNINDILDLTDTTEDDLFAFKINYNSADNATDLFNGNISETYWRTRADNMTRKYSYIYDDLNRLSQAVYKNTSNGVVNTYNEVLSYDKNGNIKNLHRNGGFESQTQVQTIDNLDYFYNNNSNLLKKVVDLSNSSQGFNDDSNGSLATDLENDYDYDLFGNMTKDQNKYITNIKYNHLNLPIEIDFTNSRTINYTYDAIGSKLKKEVFDGTYTTITTYLDGYQYEDKPTEIGGRGYNHLLFFPTAEGYVKTVYSEDRNRRLPKYQYVYNYTDHLGNVRVSYAKVNGNLKVLEETNYYPFGLKHSNYNESKAKLSRKATNDKKIIVPTNVNSYKYKYNGKELQDEFGLNWYDYGARNYQADAPHFPTIDPLAEKFYSQSPYVYAANNPVYFIDKNGMAPEDTYSVDSKGHITHVDDKKYYDKNRNEVDKLIATKNNKETMVKDGVLDNITSSKIKNVRVKIGKGKYEIKDAETTELKIEGDRDGQKLFEFLAVNTDVEWAHMRFGTSMDKGENWVSTSHFEQTESSAPNLLNTRLSIDNLRQHTHSHPNRYIPRPSIADRNFAFDVNMENTHTVLSIFATGSSTYRDYNENGTMWNSLYKD